MTMLQAEAQHRGHAIVEQVIADLKNGPLARLPSGVVRRQQRLMGLSEATSDLEGSGACSGRQVSTHAAWTLSPKVRSCPCRSWEGRYR